MRSTFFVLAFIFSSTTAFARQYIQCSIMDDQSTDVMVVNLQTPENGTLFLSSGMQNPEDERVLVNIAFDKIQNGKHIFKVTDEQGKGSVSIPSEVMGVSSNFFLLELNFSEFSFGYSCFARIYND